MGIVALQKQRANDQGTIERSLVDTLCVMETAKHSNQAEFDRLDKEFKWLGVTCAGVQTVIGSTILVPEPITQAGSLLAGTVTTKLAMQRADKVRTISTHGKALDEAFRDRDVQIFCDIPVPEQGRLDLFLKFPIPPQKAIFTIGLRTQGKATVVYNEQKEALYIRGRSGGLRRWKRDHIERLARQESWLRQNRQAELFGTSSRDKNRSVVKLLVLTGETKLAQHSDHLYRQIGDQRVLLLQRRASIYVLQEDQLIPFIQGWFAQ